MQSSDATKITFLGDASVGKSSLVARFVRNEFSNNQASTIGAAFSTLKYTSQQPHHKERVIHIWDTAGQERYFSLIPLYLSGASIVVIVYDITNRDSYDDIQQKWLPYIRRNLRGNVDPAIFLLGNKCDLVAETMRHVSKEEALRFATQNDMKFMEVSAKSGQGVAQILRVITSTADKADEDEPKPQNNIAVLDIPEPQSSSWTCWGSIASGFMSKIW